MNIANLLAGIGIALTIIITVWRIRVKNISFEIITYSPLINLQKEIPKYFELRYQRKIVHNVYFLVLKIENIGNVNIKKEDFDNDISIKFKNQIRALYCEKIDSNPENLDIDIKPIDNRIVISPFLFNKQESFTIKSMIEGDGGEITIETRLEGVSKILPKGEEPKEINFLRWISAFLVFLGSIIWNSYSTLDPYSLWLYLSAFIAWRIIFEGCLYILDLKKAKNSSKIF